MATWQQSSATVPSASTKPSFAACAVGEDARLHMLRATLRHAAARVPHYRKAFLGLNLDIMSLEDLQRLPLLDRDTLGRDGTSVLIDGVVPEYIGITSGTTFAHCRRDPLLHFQVESEHQAWVTAHGFMAESISGDHPLMLRITDPDRGVEIAGAFPGCFSVPLENPYHFQLILALLKREWSFPGFSKRVLSISGPLDALQLLTLALMERNVDPREFSIGLVSSSGWQITSRWRRLLECYWGTEVQDVYGLSEAPGMFAARCPTCSSYHFSPLSVIEILGLNHNEPITSGVGRVIVTCLLPFAHAQPLIRYDTGEVIDIRSGCPLQPFGFEYLGRRSDLIFLQKEDGTPQPVLSRMMITEVLDSNPAVACEENPKTMPLGLRNSFGWPRYRVDCQMEPSGRHLLELSAELRWAPFQYPDASDDLRKLLQDNILAASRSLSAAVARGDVRFALHLLEPGSIAHAA
jgi:hypothetical protein